MSNNNPANGTNGQTVAVNAAEYAALLATVKALQEQAAKPKPEVTFTFADKGGISANGFGRFPTSLYAEQWLKLLKAAHEQDLEGMILTALSKGERLLKGAKDELPASIMQRSIAFGVAELAKRTAASVPVPVAPVTTVAIPVAK